MALTVTAIGTLTKDPQATKSGTGTIWKIKSFGREITLFSQDDPAEARMTYRAGMRVRGEGRGGWSEFNEEWSLTLGNSAIDGSDAEDDIKIKVDGVLNRELEVRFDEADEGGGKYIPVEIEATVRGKNKAGDWDDIPAYVQAHVLEQAVDELLKLDKEGVTRICFTGFLDADSCYVNGEVSYRAEITHVAPSQGRGGDSDSFWSSKPKGLANRKSTPVKLDNQTRMKLSDRPKVRTTHGVLDDDVPF